MIEESEAKKYIELYRKVYKTQGKQKKYEQLGPSQTLKYINSNSQTLESIKAPTSLPSLKQSQKSVWNSLKPDSRSR
jgi:hypothetical protein